MTSKYSSIETPALKQLLSATREHIRSWRTTHERCDYMVRTTDDNLRARFEVDQLELEALAIVKELNSRGVQSR